MPILKSQASTFDNARWRTIATFSGAGLLLLIGVVAILLSYRILPPPDNAMVIADDERTTYASTPCVLFNHLDRELIGNRGEIADQTKPLELLRHANEKTMAEMKADPKWKRDSACNFATGFDQIVTTWMRLTGYRSRWAEDGQWRW